MENRWLLYDFLGGLFKLLAVMGVLMFIGGLVTVYYDEFEAELLWGAGLGLALGGAIGASIINIIQKGEEEKLKYEAAMKYLENPPPPPIFCSHCGRSNPGGASVCIRCQSPIGHVEKDKTDA